MSVKLREVARVLPLAVALAACGTKPVDTSAQQRWQSSIDAKQPTIDIVGAKPPSVVSDHLIDVVPLQYTVSDPDALVNVTVDGAKPFIIPGDEGAKKILANVGTEGAHLIQISAKHCEKSPEFGYYCSPESIFQATIISDFTPPNTSIESMSVLPDGRIQINYVLNDATAQFGGIISYADETLAFDSLGKASLVFDFSKQNLNQIRVQVCDSVQNCRQESFFDSLADTTPPQLTLINEEVIKGDRIITYQLQDNWQELLPYGAKVSIGNETVFVHDANGIVTVKQTDVAPGTETVTTNAVDPAGNLQQGLNTFTYNPFPTSVEMITMQNGSVTFRLHVDTTRDNFDPDQVAVETTQDANPSILNTFPLLKRMLCSNPMVDAQTIEVTCKPLIPSGKFAFTLTGEAAGGQTWKSNDTFTMDLPNASADAKLWYVFMTGMAYASMVAASGVTGTAIARRYEEEKRRKRVAVFAKDVMHEGKPLSNFLFAHDQPSTIDKVVYATKRGLSKKKSKKNELAHKLSRSERGIYAQIEHVWKGALSKNDLFGALIQVSCIDAYGYPSLNQLKWEAMTELLRRVQLEFDEIYRNRSVQGTGSHRIKQLRTFIKKLPTNKGFLHVPKDIAKKLLATVEIFEFILQAKAMSPREFVEKKGLENDSLPVKHLVYLYDHLLDWGNFTTAREIRKIQRLGNVRGLLDEKYNTMMQIVRSQFLQELRDSDDGVVNQVGRVKLLKRYVEDMKLPHGLIAEFNALIDLDTARRTHDYVKMMSSFGQLVSRDSSLPFDLTFRTTVEDALAMIRTDLDQYFITKDISRMPKEMYSKVIQFDLMLNELQKTGWWQAIRNEHKDIVENRVKILSIVIGANIDGYLDKKYGRIIDSKNEDELFAIIQGIAEWKNFLGVAQFIESITSKDDLLGRSLGRRSDEIFWKPFMERIVNNLKSGRMIQACEIYNRALLNMSQGIEAKELLTNYSEFLSWKAKELPRWAHLDLFPVPETTLKEISDRVENLITHNRLNFTDALSIVKKWYEFVSLNARPVAIFHYVGIPTSDITAAIKAEDMGPLAKKLRMRLINLSAHLQRASQDKVIDPRNRTYYEIIASGLQHHWTKPVIEWIKTRSDASGKIPVPVVQKWEHGKKEDDLVRATRSIHNVFAQVAKMQETEYIQLIRNAGIEAISAFVGAF